MKQKKSLADVLRRIEAGLLAAGTLWIAVVTAGSDTVFAAAGAPRQGPPGGGFRGGRGGPVERGGVSPAGRVPPPAGR